jgi:hypothetical protein
MLVERLRLDVSIVAGHEHTSQGWALINYTQNNSLPGLWMPPSGFLDDTGVSQRGLIKAEQILDQVLHVISMANQPEEVHAYIAKQGMPDVFALCFFFLSRYEEYLPFAADTLGRFPSSQSLSARKGITHRAILDELVQLLATVLAAQFSGEVQAPDNEFAIQSTVDVDQAWAYKYKTWRSIAGRIYGSDWRGLVDAIKVSLDRSKDPFDTFDYLQRMHAECGVRCRIFFLAAAKRGPLDKNHSPALPEFRQLVRSIASWADTGVHPSAQSNQSDQLLHSEVEVVAAMTGKRVLASRQHFLLIQVPETFRRLLSNGINHDYSMGWADVPGYRAGTAFDFQWYDLLADAPTELRIHPFQVMDVTLKNYLQLDCKEAQVYVNTMISYAKLIGIPFTCIWHNSSFGLKGEWKGWTAVYESILRASKVQA